MTDNLIENLKSRYFDTMAQKNLMTRSVALLDFPNHANVGDSAIWLGELALLRSLGVRSVVYTCDLLTYSRDHLAKRIGKNGIILLHGGGNFGDVWPRHQYFREKVIEEFPNHEIVMLSQSFHFHSEDELARAASVINDHKHISILLRDKYSMELAQTQFQCPLYLVPDAAFLIDDIPNRSAAQSDIIFLARTDKEAGLRDIPAADGLNVLVTDWLDEDRGVLIRMSDILSRQLVLRPYLSLILRPLVSSTYNCMARLRFERGCRLLCSGRVLITDRLHAHILSLLLGIEHIFMDNNYGKNRRFYDTWTHSSHLAHWADSPVHAFEIARQLLRS